MVTILLEGGWEAAVDSSQLFDFFLLFTLKKAEDFSLFSALQGP